MGGDRCEVYPAPQEGCTYLHLATTLAAVGNVSDDAEALVGPLRVPRLQHEVGTALPHTAAAQQARLARRGHENGLPGGERNVGEGLSVVPLCNVYLAAVRHRGLDAIGSRGGLAVERAQLRRGKEGAQAVHVGLHVTLTPGQWRACREEDEDEREKGWGGRGGLSRGWVEHCPRCALARDTGPAAVVPRRSRDSRRGRAATK